VYTELKRVQQYFSKIKALEEPEAKRNLVVNQEAAARILKADLVRLILQVDTLRLG
jgi:exosome complex protein LRP1